MIVRSVLRFEDGQLDVHPSIVPAILLCSPKFTSLTNDDDRSAGELWNFREQCFRFDVPPSQQTIGIILARIIQERYD